MLHKMSLSDWMKTHSKEEYLELWDKKCNGQWEVIFSRCGADLALESLNGKKHVACPHHQGKTDENYRARPTFQGKSFDDIGAGTCNTCGTKGNGFFHLNWLFQHKSMKDTRDLIRHSMGWTYGEILNEPSLDRELTEAEAKAWEEKRVRENERMKAEKIKRAEEKKVRDAKKSAFLINLAKRLKSTCVELNDESAEPARLYFKSRGIQHIEHIMEHTSHVLFSPGFEVYANGKNYGEHMSIVSFIYNSKKEFLYTHRIIIDEMGNKVKFPFGSKLKSPAIPGKDNIGRALRPFPAHAVQGVCEGVEVMAAVLEATGMPVDSATDAPSLEVWEPTDETVELVLIFEDKDRPSKQHSAEGGHGRHSAQKLVKKLADMGIVAIRITPPFDIPEQSKSVDWNDVYANFKLDYFPEIVKNWRQVEREILADNLTAEMLRGYGLDI